MTPNPMQVLYVLLKLNPHRAAPTLDKPDGRPGPKKAPAAILALLVCLALGAAGLYLLK